MPAAYFGIFLPSFKLGLVLILHAWLPTLSSFPMPQAWSSVYTTCLAAYDIFSHPPGLEWCSYYRPACLLWHLSPSPKLFPSLKHGLVFILQVWLPTMPSFPNHPNVNHTPKVTNNFNPIFARSSLLASYLRVSHKLYEHFCVESCCLCSWKNNLGCTKAGKPGLHQTSIKGKQTLQGLQ